jgi:hypothetical protein
MAFTVADQVALSRAFARFSLTRAEVQRDPALSRLVERKLEKLDRVAKSLTREGSQLNSRLWNL